MTRKDNIQRLKQEINTIRRSIKTAEKGIIKAYEIARAYPGSNPEALYKQEKHFRALRRKLSQMQEQLQALQEGIYQPVRVPAWQVRRTEVSLLCFCEA